MSFADPQTWGPRLYAHLEAHWRATGTNQNAWSYANGIQGSTVSRWRTGGMPSLQAMRDVANVLDTTMLDILLIAGIVDETEVGRAASAPATISPPEVAIAHDPTLSDWQRKHVLDFLASLRDVATRTEAERTRPRGRKPR